MIKKLFIPIVIAILLISCKDGFIDEITQVSPGEDTGAPIVTAISPANGSQVNAPNDVSNVVFEIEVTDDVELANISVQLNGTAIASYDSFKDYRKLIIDLEEELGLGTYEVQVSATDVSGKSTNETITFTKINTIRELMNESVLHLDFNGDFEDNISSTSATVVGSPSINTSDGVDGDSFSGATDSYLSFPTTSLTNPEFSAAFFYKLNDTPDRAGILVMGPIDDTPPANNRTKGFRLFRENVGGNQRITLNAGNGTADSWFNSDSEYHLAPGSDWVSVAFTISDSECIVYINGEVAAQGAFTGIDWTDCDILSIASGDPRFVEWGHLSDESLIDELLIYDRVLSAEEVGLLGQLLNN